MSRLSGEFDATADDEVLFRNRSGTVTTPAEPILDLQSLLAEKRAKDELSDGHHKIHACTPFPPDLAAIFKEIEASNRAEHSAGGHNGISNGPNECSKDGDNSNSNSNNSSGDGHNNINKENSRFEACPGCDRYVAHGPVSKPGKDRNWLFLITTKGYYKIDPKTYHPEWRCEIKDLSAVECLGESGIRLHRRTAQTVFSKGTGLFGWKKKKELVASTISTRDFNCADASTRDDWVLALRRLLRDNWQKVLEKSTGYMPKGEVYQMHVFLTKLNKKNQPQLRVLCVSDKRMLNVEPRGVDLGVVKWEIPISALRSIDCQADDGISFTLYLDSTSDQITKKQNMKSAVGFIASDPDERTFVQETLCRLFKDATGEELKVYRA